MKVNLHYKRIWST